MTRARTLTDEQYAHHRAEMERQTATYDIERALRWCDENGWLPARAVAAEVRRLRALPVIQTCGDCGWNAADLVTDRCVHDDRDTENDAVDVRGAPPSWCPLRGEASR